MCVCLRVCACNLHWIRTLENYSWPGLPDHSVERVSFVIYIIPECIHYCNEPYSGASERILNKKLSFGTFIKPWMRWEQLISLLCALFLSIINKSLIGREYPIGLVWDLGLICGEFYILWNCDIFLHILGTETKFMFNELCISIYSFCNYYDLNRVSFVFTSFFRPSTSTEVKDETRLDWALFWQQSVGPE